MRRAAALLALLASAGCGLKLSPPPALETTPVLLPAEVLARMLTQVDAQGRVNYEPFANHPSTLDLFASYLAAFSPESDPDRFPTAASRLAYYINAYNSLVLYAVVDSRLRPADQKPFYRRAKMMVGGSLRTLEDLEAAVAALKDARAYFALCGGAKGHPKLSPRPYEPGTLEAQLEAAAKAFLDDPANVRVDRARRVVKASQVLKWHADAFKDQAASLLAFVNRYRAQKVPEDFKVEFVPFDWSLNSLNDEKRPAPAKRRDFSVDREAASERSGTESP